MRKALEFGTFMVIAAGIMVALALAYNSVVPAYPV